MNKKEVDEWEDGEDKILKKEHIKSIPHRNGDTVTIGDFWKICVSGEFKMCALYKDSIKSPDDLTGEDDYHGFLIIQIKDIWIETGAMAHEPHEEYEEVLYTGFIVDMVPKDYYCGGRVIGKSYTFEDDWFTYATMVVKKDNIWIHQKDT